MARHLLEFCATKENGVTLTMKVGSVHMRQSILSTLVVAGWMTVGFLPSANANRPANYYRHGHHPHPGNHGPYRYSQPYYGYGYGYRASPYTYNYCLWYPAYCAQVYRPPVVVVPPPVYVTPPPVVVYTPPQQVVVPAPTPAPPPLPTPKYVVSSSPNQDYTDQTLWLSQMPEVKAYEGYAVTRVEVWVGPGRGDSRIKLKLNDVVEDVVVPRERYHTLTVRGRRLLGRDIQTLQLQVDQTAYIEAFTIHFER